MNDGPDDQGPDGLESDELALRRILHDAVQEIEPRDGTLERLRRAVPARRARKRQALVGMAAAALFVGTAVPAVVHVSTSGGADVNPSAAGHGEQAQGGSGQGKETEGGGSGSGGPSGRNQDQDKGGGKEKDRDAGSGAGSGSGGVADPAATAAAGLAACTAAQFGAPVGSAGVPDSSGAVYGGFRFTNASAADCTVGGPGSVSFVAQGAADTAKISTARHTAGDAAAGLPDPSQELGAPVLRPGDSYQVKFAWIPSATCPANGDSGGGTGGGDPSPDPTPTGGGTGSTDGTSTGTGLAPQTLPQNPTLDGSVVVAGTAEAGAPTATVTLNNACAGVIYWTGVLPGA
ncbi:hypothetical protein SZN_26551 [Streptomyces zinciresistens K42]|uniref:DUF4232 domain-containing protein n=1 Tax=Streptomyces zinciresistens K42 TaxID=700597 RepID=G2GIH0_9ACTN|nr:hypothetical protein SZN_26551 [Streptomyces zinciresistens K42]